jgi:hypothetical protein
MDCFKFDLTPRKLSQSVTIFCLILTLFLVGCGESGDTTRSTRNTNDQTTQTAITKPLNSVIHSLYTVKERYAENTTGSKKSVRNELQSARNEWNQIVPTVKTLKSNQFINSVETQFNELDTSLKEGDSIERVDTLADTLTHTLTALRISQLEDVRRSVVRSIREADRDITAETTVDDYRIGITLTEPATIYDTNDLASSTENASHQLRVILRDKSTKRKLAGSEISAEVLDQDGDTLTSIDLLETWGDYHFYGENLTLPDEAASVRITVGPPLVGRHEDMKNLYLGSVTAEFMLAGDTETRTFRYRPTSPVDTGTRLGNDVAMAYQETLDIVTSGPYRIGFIAEHAEPFWLVDRRSENGSFSLRQAEVPQSANRHLEIVLFTRDYRIVPHANVSLSVINDKDTAKAKFQLPYLMSTFNHYGNSLYLPAANYSVDASVGAPTIHTLKRDVFAESAAASFSWNPDE